MKAQLFFLLILVGVVPAQSPPAPEKRIYLTFEGGPREGTETVLTTLKQLELKATFFLVGSNKDAVGGEQEQRELLLHILEDKHSVGNFTFTCTPAALDDYIETYGEGHFKDDVAHGTFVNNFVHNQTYFQQLISRPSFVFRVARLPGDRKFVDSLVSANKYLLTEVRQLGLTYHSWDVEFVPNGIYPQREKSGKDLQRSWHGLGVAATIANTALPGNNQVLLFHDQHWECNTNAENLKAILQTLKDQHYEFVTW